MNPSGVQSSRARYPLRAGSEFCLKIFFFFWSVTHMCMCGGVAVRNVGLEPHISKFKF